MTCGSGIFAESLGSSVNELASVSYRFFLWVNRKKLLCCGKLFQFCCLICLTQVCFARSIARLQKESATVAFVVKDLVLKCFEKLHLPVIHVVFLSSPSVEWVERWAAWVAPKSCRRSWKFGSPWAAPRAEPTSQHLDVQLQS